MSMGLQAYGICRGCAGLHPAAHGCPTCDGDRVSAAHMETERIAYVAGAKRESIEVAPPPRLRNPARGALFAAFGVSLFVGTLLIAVLQA